jgi:hypothetical protein
MRTTALLTNNDARRRSAVEFIQNTYAARYDARLEVFSSRITTLFDDREDIFTRRLHIMVCRLGITPTFLVEADCLRIADAEPWGTHYACQPKAYAVASQRLKIGCDGFQRGVRNAAAV